MITFRMVRYRIRVSPSRPRKYTRAQQTHTEQAEKRLVIGEDSGWSGRISRGTIIRLSTRRVRILFQATIFRIEAHFTCFRTSWGVLVDNSAKSANEFLSFVTPRLYPLMSCHALTKFPTRLFWAPHNPHLTAAKKFAQSCRKQYIHLPSTVLESCAPQLHTTPTIATSKNHSTSFSEYISISPQSLTTSQRHQKPQSPNLKRTKELNWAAYWILG